MLRSGSGTRKEHPMSERDDYQAAMEGKLDTWTARLDALEADAVLGGDEAYRTLLNEWRTGGNVARAKLAELKAAKGNRWDVVRPQMARAWEAIAGELRDAASGAALPGSINDTNPSTRITQRGMAVADPGDAADPE
jgi:hypothetical protein